MKPYSDYHPPEDWVMFHTLKPGNKFHDIIDGQPVQFMVLKTLNSHNAVNLQTGDLKTFCQDEFVYPVDAGWVAELNCYGFQINKQLEAQGHRAILAYVMSQTEGRKANDHWRQEIKKFLPQIGIMSFIGAEQTIRWLMDRVEIKSGDAVLAKELKAIQDSEGPEDKKARERLETFFPGLHKPAILQVKDPKKSVRSGHNSFTDIDPVKE